MDGHLPAVVASGSIGIKRDPAVPELPAIDAFWALIEEGKLHKAPALYYLGLLASEEGDLEEARSLLNRAALASGGKANIQPHALEAGSAPSSGVTQEVL